MVGAAKSIDQALTGQIAGVSVTNTSGAPGSPAKIRIRGTASMNGTQDPLWVLDGIPLEGTDTVSYTHLDVYKRQSLLRRCTSQSGKCPVASKYQKYSGRSY